MRLMRLTEFRETCLAGEHRPTLRTLRRWPGAQKCGGEWYIDLDQRRVVTVTYQNRQPGEIAHERCGEN